MSVLPSILEYTEDKLRAKMEAVIEYGVEPFFQLAEQDTLAFHLDCILPLFASSRSIQPTLSLLETVALLKEFWGSTRLRLNLHVMGQAEESSAAVLDFLQCVDEAWHGEILVPFHLYRSISTELPAGWILGAWYDKDMYNLQTEFVTSCNLLMTVRAGKAGQHADPVTKQKAYHLAVENPEFSFVLDGGWSMSEIPVEKHIEVAMYNKLWNEVQG